MARCRACDTNISQLNKTVSGMKGFEVHLNEAGEYIEEEKYFEPEETYFFCPECNTMIDDTYNDRDATNFLKGEPI